MKFIITIRFTCGDTKILSNIKMSQNIMTRIADIDKILYDKDLYEAKYQFLFNKRQSTGLKYLKDSKAFIEYESAK